MIMSKIKKIKYIHYLLSFIILIYSLIYILRIDPNIINLIKASCGIICLILALFVCDRKYISITLKYCVLLSILMLLSLLYNSNADIIHLLWIWSYWGVALLIFYCGLSLKQTKFIFYICCISYSYFSFTTHLATSNNTLFTHFSNSISVVCIFCLCMHNIAINNNNNKYQILSYTPIFFVLFNSAWASNRSGILCSIIYLGLLLIIKFKETSLLKTIIPLFILIIIGAYLIQNYSYTFFSIEQKLERYDGFESARSDIWLEYFNGTFDNLGNFLFGVPYNSAMYPVFRHYEGNAHNVFLMLHSKFGIIGFVIIIYFIMKVFFIMFKKKDYILFISFTLIILRSMFDWTAFTGMYDIFFYYFILYSNYPKYKPICANR